VPLNRPEPLVRSNMRRLTCPAIAMIVESEAPFSASCVMAQIVERGQNSRLHLRISRGEWSVDVVPWEALGICYWLPLLRQSFRDLFDDFLIDEIVAQAGEIRVAVQIKQTDLALLVGCLQVVQGIFFLAEQSAGCG
jgi:hypothetical protein